MPGLNVLNNKKKLKKKYYFRLSNTTVHFNSKLKYKIQQVFVPPNVNPLAHRIAIIEIDGFVSFDEFNQAVHLPQFPFHGLANELAVTYFDDDFAFVRK